MSRVFLLPFFPIKYLPPRSLTGPWYHSNCSWTGHRWLKELVAAGVAVAGLSYTEQSIWEFPFLRGDSRQGGISIWYCVNVLPQKETLDKLHTPICFRILSPSLCSVSIFSFCCYSIVCIYLCGRNDSLESNPEFTNSGSVLGLEPRAGSSPLAKRRWRNKETVIGDWWRNKRL